MVSQRVFFVRGILVDVDYFVRGVVGLTGITVGFGLVIGPFVICSAISRVIDELTPSD
ncbi:MAG: hypothetical protein HZA94_01510 [Candidatus Vogelbacteria bacterium]|nr:hypothetical protein [Candidatus Vogelbacteria bacterium]